MNYFIYIFSLKTDVFLHVHFYFEQNFILFVALLNSARANIYCKFSVLSKFFWKFVVKTYLNCVFVLPVFFIVFLIFLTTI